jgi:hypothetical protein
LGKRKKSVENGRIKRGVRKIKAASRTLEILEKIVLGIFIP